MNKFILYSENDEKVKTKIKVPSKNHKLRSQMKSEESKKMTVEEAFEVIEDMIDEENKDYQGEYKNDGRFEDKYFDEETGALNLRIPEAREKMKEKMPGQLRLLNHMGTSQTQRKKSNTSKLILLKTN